MAATALAQAPAATSATGVLSLLEEQENSLRIAALERLNEVVDQFWHEVADYLTDIEQLYEDQSFPGRELAALVASKVFYHLEGYGEALRLALGAGQLFDLSQRSEYIEKVVAVAIDEYIELKTENFERELKKKEEPKPIDARLEDVVNRMFERCREDKAFKQGLGMALECRRLDMVKVFITQSDDVGGMLEYCQKTALAVTPMKAFRESVLETLVEVHTSTKDVNYSSLCQCYFVLNRAQNVAEILKMLISSENKDGWLMANQIALDVVDNENQHFCNELLKSPLLKIKEPPAAPPPAPAPAEGEEAPAPAAAEPAPMQVEEQSPAEKENLVQLRRILSGRASIDLHLEFLYRNNRTDLLLLEMMKTSVDQKNSITHNGTVMAHGLMQCGTTSDVFLRKNLEWLAKASNWAKFTATASLGVIHKGHITESRSILSTYLPQGGGAAGSPYSEGGALYAMGLIHANHYDAETKGYLTEQLANATSSEILQHGACLGIGLVCMATADDGVYEELKQTLFTDTAVAGEAAAYAIGLVMVGSASEKAISELLAYAHETQHEKIIRACGLALAFMMFRREEEAETIIQQLLLDKDAILRYGACFCIGLAYVGTSQNAAIRKLLHISVSDVSDDVRRAAVINLGFVMCNSPDQLPGVVKLLCESYNPHVRYAAAMALGIAGAGSANPESHELLQPLLADRSDFVRQGALIGLGLLYMQTSPGKSEKVKEFRDKLFKVVADKHEDVMVRFGAILANGILDAGGRNCCASFFANSGGLRRGAAIGFCLFAQMWYWFPLIHMFSLTLMPTALIGLNERLKIPKNFSVKCNAKPSLFAYPEPMQPPKKEEQVGVAKAVLSTAAKAKQLKEKKDKEEELKKGAAATTDADVDDKASACNSMVDGVSVTGRDAMSVAATQGTTIVGSTAGSVAASDIASDMMGMDVEVEEPAEKPAATDKPAATAAAGESKDMEVDSEKKDKKEAKDKDAKDAKASSKEGKEARKEPAVPEPSEEILKNPCRVLPAQMQYISFLTEGDAGEPARYAPVLQSRKTGFLMLRDTKPEEPEDLFLEDDKAKQDEDEEPPPPEPFEWTDN